MKPCAVTLTLALGLAAAPAKAEDAFSCPVTKAAPLRIDPGGAFAGQQAKLFGNEKLFTVFPGNWHTTQPSDRGYRVPKIVWGTAAFDLREEWTKSSLTITGRRLDASSAPLEFGGANTARIEEGYFITSEFFIPSLGCWEVTGHFHGAELRVVVELR